MVYMSNQVLFTAAVEKVEVPKADESKNDSVPIPGTHDMY